MLPRLLLYRHHCVATPVRTTRRFWQACGAMMERESTVPWSAKAARNRLPASLKRRRVQSPRAPHTLAVHVARPWARPGRPDQRACAGVNRHRPGVNVMCTPPRESNNPSSLQREPPVHAACVDGPARWRSRHERAHLAPPAGIWARAASGCRTNQRRRRLCRSQSLGISAAPKGDLPNHVVRTGMKE